MLRTLTFCLLSALTIMIGSCGAGQVSVVPATAAQKSTVPLAVGVLPTPTPATAAPPSPLAPPAAAATTAGSTTPHLTSYTGRNTYGQEYPDFIVYYDPALWTLVLDPAGYGDRLASTQVPSCTVPLGMGAFGAPAVQQKQIGPYEWYIGATRDPRGFLYWTSVSSRLNFTFGLDLPDAEASERNQTCMLLAEDVMRTAAFVPGTGSAVGAAPGGEEALRVSAAPTTTLHCDSSADVRTALESVTAHEVAARREQDWPALLSLVHPSADVKWLEQQRYLLDPALASVDLTRIESGSRWALAAAIETYTVGPAGITQVYTTRTFRQRNTGCWELMSPRIEAWGALRELAASSIALRYYEFDDPYVRAAAPRIMVILRHMAIDLGIDLKTDDVFEVQVNPPVDRLDLAAADDTG